MLMGRLVERASLGTSATQVFAMEDFAAVLASKAKSHAMSAMSLARVLNVRKHTSLDRTTGPLFITTSHARTPATNIFSLCYVLQLPLTKPEQSQGLRDGEVSYSETFQHELSRAVSPGTSLQ